MAEEKDPESTEAIVAELHKKIKEAFEVFDHESNNTVDVEEEEPTGYIRFEKFIPVMTTVLLEKRYRPIAEDVLLRAFEVLDPTKRGFLTKDELVKYMTEEGQRALFLVSLSKCFPDCKWLGGQSLLPVGTLSLLQLERSSASSAQLPDAQPDLSHVT
ncbi:dynein regulatory complex protein 8 isoform X21 [Rattus norvegicus]|uniref:dynein regulatory complex protein 8 isoform X21 n=1 Tax=Rattus norvegicus TaxID=10116 RepID=UPI002FD7C2F6